MTRHEKLCRYLDGCTVFADVGCDHGYCTQYMLEKGLCESAIISDVSPKCLEKAKTLLKDYIDGGKVTPVCCDGLEKIPENVGEVLIAGMGGEEIISILGNSFIPLKFVLQPMKNVRKVREYLIGKNAKIALDEPFKSGKKFYYVIKGERNGNAVKYTECELDYGKNLHSEATKAYLREELKKKLSYLDNNLNSDDRARILADVSKIEEILYES